ncbi:MAG: hypothetical protein AVDCRST_MAG06-117, partial [uncultured Nocardioides sp.]
GWTGRWPRWRAGPWSTTSSGTPMTSRRRSRPTAPARSTGSRATPRTSAWGSASSSTGYAAASTSALLPAAPPPPVEGRA